MRWVKAGPAVFDTIALMIEISSSAGNGIFCATAGSVMLLFMVVLLHKGKEQVK